MLTKGYFEILQNWESEASPTLRCSIEISRDIYICMYVFDCLWENNTKNCMLKCMGGITWSKHVRAQKVVLGF